MLEWFNISYPHYNIFHKSGRVHLTGHSLLPLLQPHAPHPSQSDAVYASHNLHEVTMYYPMRVIRTPRYKLIQNLNHGQPFPIDQDFYVSVSFQDLLNRTRHQQPLHWFKTLHQYYHRDPWQLYDLMADPHETHNLASQATHATVLKQLQQKLHDWQNVTSDPWICAPSGVLEDSGVHKGHPVCLGLDNGESADDGQGSEGELEHVSLTNRLINIIRDTLFD